jgi:predicted nucleic-acid-binding protein
MIAFDTNHLLRHVLQDEPEECQQVAALLQEQFAAGHPVLILDLVIMETCWVLTKVYGFDASAWVHVMESLLSDSGFTFQDASMLRRTLTLYQAGKADFNDYFILARAQAQGATLETLDQKLRRSL